jgi:OmpA-OmpF porin, OOP family
MRQFFWGLIILILWNWFVCGLKGLCQQPTPQVIVELAPQPSTPPPEPEPKAEPTPEPAPTPELQVQAPLVLPDIYFIFDREIVKNMDELMAITKQAVEYLSQNPKSKVYITGYTCNTGIEEHNFDLGFLRADTVKKYMISQGAAEDRFIIASKGPREPKVPNDTQEDKMENRRVHITVK